MSIRNFIIYLIILSATSNVGAQVAFSHGDLQMTLIDRKSFSEAVPYDQHVSIHEDPWVKLFKQYFNASSYEVFKSFFLPQDWGGHSKEQFQQWQATLKTDKLFLQQVLHVRDDAGREFLVFQYSMETAARTLLHSMILKRHQQTWKHLSIMNDKEAIILKRLGDMDIASLNEQIQSRTASIKLDKLQAQQVRTYIEKFDRQEVFSRIGEVLNELNVSDGDIINARQFFLASQDQAMIDFIVAQYGAEEATLIAAINTKCGFKLLNQALIAETK